MIKVDAMTHMEHEQAFVSVFVVPEKRGRYAELLGKPKRRAQITGRFCHFFDFVPELAKRVERGHRIGAGTRASRTRGRRYRACDRRQTRDRRTRFTAGEGDRFCLGGSERSSGVLHPRSPRTLHARVSTRGHIHFELQAMTVRWGYQGRPEDQLSLSTLDIMADGSMARGSVFGSWSRQRVKNRVDHFALTALASGLCPVQGRHESDRGLDAHWFGEAVPPLAPNQATLAPPLAQGVQSCQSTTSPCRMQRRFARLRSSIKSAAALIYMCKTNGFRFAGCPHPENQIEPSWVLELQPMGGNASPAHSLHHERGVGLL